MSQEKDLELYYFESCPFCQKVLTYLDTRDDLEVTLKDIHENLEYKEELSEINDGVTQVPCLVIDGDPMLESDDIVEYLKGLE